MLDLSQQIDDLILIDGTEYEVDMSFDNVLRLFDMLRDKELSDVEQIVLGIHMLLDEPLDLPIEKLEAVFHEIFTEMIGKGKEDDIPVDIEGNPMPQVTKEAGERVYSMKQDAEYIYASFMQAYGIDLIDAQGSLHWYKFQALLEGLPKDTKFKEVIEIRTMDLPTGKGTGKQKEAIKKAKKAYQLKREP